MVEQLFLLTSLGVFDILLCQDHGSLGLLEVGLAASLRELVAISIPALQGWQEAVSTSVSLLTCLLRLMWVVIRCSYMSSCLIPEFLLVCDQIVFINDLIVSRHRENNLAHVVLGC